MHPLQKQNQHLRTNIQASAQTEGRMSLQPNKVVLVECEVPEQRNPAGTRTKNVLSECAKTCETACVLLETQGNDLTNRIKGGLTSSLMLKMICGTHIDARHKTTTHQAYGITREEKNPTARSKSVRSSTRVNNQHQAIKLLGKNKQNRMCIMEIPCLKLSVLCQKRPHISLVSQLEWTTNFVMMKNNKRLSCEKRGWLWAFISCKR